MPHHLPRHFSSQVGFCPQPMAFLLLHRVKPERLHAQGGARVSWADLGAGARPLYLPATPRIPSGHPEAPEATQIPSWPESMSFTSKAQLPSPPTAKSLVLASPARAWVCLDSLLGPSSYALRTLFPAAALYIRAAPCHALPGATPAQAGLCLLPQSWPLPAHRLSSSSVLVREFGPMAGALGVCIRLLRPVLNLPLGLRSGLPSHCPLLSDPPQNGPWCCRHSGLWARAPRGHWMTPLLQDPATYDSRPSAPTHRGTGRC